MKMRCPEICNSGHETVSGVGVGANGNGAINNMAVNRQAMLGVTGSTIATLGFEREIPVQEIR